jgi:drug/metabolite transporter (DMT)-like permease
MASSLYVTAESPAQHASSGLSVTDLLLLCMALIWGLNFIVVKYATTVFAPLAFNSTRIAVALVILWAILLARGTTLPPRRDMLVMIGLGVLGNGLYQILWVEGMARTRASDAALLVSASPAFIEILGWLRGNERLGKRGMIGMALSMCGIGLVVSGGVAAANRSSTLVGNALILSSVLCWAVYSVMLRPVTLRYDGLTISAVTMTGGMIAMLIAAAPSLAATQWSTVSLAGWGAVAYSSVMALVVAYLFWYRGIAVLGPTRASMYSNLQPVFAMAGAWALLSETPRIQQIAGGACIVGGLLLTRLPGRASVVAVE